MLTLTEYARVPTMDEFFEGRLTAEDALARGAEGLVDIILAQ
jgi:hypothetical protein